MLRAVPAPADVTIIGGGIVGLATAIALTERHPRARVQIVDKEARVGTHQTGHNSGVIHSGIYYKPGSLKARICVEGARLMTEFCDTHGIAYERCGKVIVATSEAELPRLETLHQRGTANGVPGLKMIPGEAVKELRAALPRRRARCCRRPPASSTTCRWRQAMAALVEKRGGEVTTARR